MLDTFQTIEREVRTYDDSVFLMRLSPYRTADSRILGVVASFVNITDRKLAEQERAFLASIVDSSQDSIITINFERIITSWNKSAERLYGYTASEAIGKPLTMLTMPEDLREILGNIESIRNSETVKTFDSVRVHKDNRHMNLEVVLSPVKDAAGKIIGASTIARNVTERRMAEAALHRSEERQRLIIDSATDYAIFTLDPDRLITTWNTGAGAIFKYTEAEILGQPGDILFAPEDQAKGIPAKETAKALEEGKAENERWHIRKDGSRFFGSGLTMPLRDDAGAVIGFVSIMRDLTEQKRTEVALSLSEERYRTALQAADMSAWDWNIQEDRVIWNEQHYTMLGLEPDQQTKNKQSFVEFIHPEDAPRVEAELAAVTSGGADMFHSEFRIVRYDNGMVKWMVGYGRVIEHRDGIAARMVGVMYDITARKALEQQKDDFIGIASHELKTPATSIKAYSELLLSLLSKSGDEKGKGMAQKLDVQVDRLISLIHTLLDTKQIDQGQLELKRSTFDMNRLLEERVEEIQRISPAHQIVLQTGTLSPVTGDRERIGQVLANLLNNAVKYSPDGGAVIVSAAIVERHLEICVQDFGIGMQEATRQRIFERFYRDTSARVNTFSGLGLGLYIASEIIRLHGGMIGVESKVGEGSRFHFTLPLGEGKQ